MKVLFMDFETQSAEPATTKFTECGAILYSYEGGIWREEASFCELAYEPDYPPQSELIIALTGITDEMLRTAGRPRKEILDYGLLPLYRRADIVVAHKIFFDQTILESTCKLLGLPPPPIREQLCTLTNFPWPKTMTCHKLGHLGWEHGSETKAKDLHRADDDCRLLHWIVSQYDFDAVMAHARTPWVYLKADCAGPWVDGGKQTGFAKTLGFSFEKCKGTEGPMWPKKWVMRTKENELDYILKAVESFESPFRIDKIEGIQ